MNLVWREARMTDADLLWRWANDRETRQNSFTKSPILYGEHVTWFERRLTSDATRIWIFNDGDTPVGQVRFDITGDVAEIGITVAPDQRGRGYGKAMLADALRCLYRERGGRVRPRASVFVRNTASLRLFRACGFEEIGTASRDGDEQVIVLGHSGVIS
jgi:UDP-2,4-diacetamido-2,4,6-trideoxy-beta-L-altropyranose hydrolase